MVTCDARCQAIRCFFKGCERSIQLKFSGLVDEYSVCIDTVLDNVPDALTPKIKFKSVRNNSFIEGNAIVCLKNAIQLYLSLDIFMQ
jgi:hypothetical protein